MRFLSLILLTTMVQTLGAQMVNPGAAEELREYTLGRTAGECLVARCTVFSGYLAADSPQADETVSVRVEDRLFGAAVPGTVQLPYAALHESPRGPARVLAHIWSGVTLRTNAPVIVVLGQSTSDSPRADTPRVVTSSQQNIEIIRSLVSEALRLETSPESIHDAIASLAHVQNPALAGFLVVHLRRIDTIHNPDTAATLLVQIVDNENVPASEREDIVDSIVLDYDRLTDGNRALIVSRFAKLGASEDAGLAALGLRGLVKISDFDQSVGTMVPASAVGAIGRNYRTLMARGALAHSDALEKVLGIR